MSQSVTNIKKLNKIANTIRQDIIKMLVKAGSGHTAGSLGMADIFTALYFNVLKHDPKRPNWPERDRVILSNGHICPVWYATLAEAGYFPKAKLESLRQFGSPLQGHPYYRSLPGIENTSGPLGQGISVAAGMAYALRLKKSSSRIFCLTSDGEHDEGQTWEAVMFAAKYKLSNLTLIIDRNNIQIDGPTEKVMPLEPLKKKYEAFNWRVIEVDGNKMEEIITALKKNKARRPVCIIANTIPGKGVDFMENNFEWHGRVPNQEEAEEALRQLKNLSSRAPNVRCH